MGIYQKRVFRMNLMSLNKGIRVPLRPKQHGGMARPRYEIYIRNVNVGENTNGIMFSVLSPSYLFLPSNDLRPLNISLFRPLGNFGRPYSTKCPMDFRKKQRHGTSNLFNTKNIHRRRVNNRKIRVTICTLRQNVRAFRISYRVNTLHYRASTLLYGDRGCLFCCGG